MSTPEEKKLDPIEFGFDKDGYLKIKIHLSVGLWAMLGCLVEAQTRVMAQFGQMAKVEKDRQLVRPKGDVKDYKWH